MSDKEQLLEQVLIFRSQLGDGEAFARLVAPHQQKLHYFIRRLLGSWHAEEDVLQDIWLTVYKKIHQLRSPQAFGVWLYRIARNKAYEHLRKGRRVPPIDESAEPCEVPDESEQADWPMGDAALIHECLGKLSTSRREVLVLRFLEQMSYEDIARIVGASVGTVRSRIHYAKRDLRQKMEDMGHAK